MKNKKIPEKFINDFTMNDRVELIYDCDDIYIDNKKSYDIREENIKKMIEKIKLKENFPLSKDGCIGSSYENIDELFYTILDSNDYDIRGKNILIIGTTTGWFESFIIAYGGIPHVVEYVDVEYDGEQIIYYTIEDLSKLDFKFDFCVSFSSYEHDGLGRYGDLIDPNGDLKSMKGLKTVMKEDGILFLAVPIGLDKVVFNLHRIYGKVRLPLLFQQWKLLGSSGWWWDQLNGDFGCGHQPIFVLQNTDNKKYNTNYYKNLFKFSEIAISAVIVY
ncbi:DUF268 domain-containing protein [bacterium]|nr:DUF268 domain-containing protein [bacterium]